MKKNKWITDFVKENYNTMSDRELAAKANVNHVTIFNIRKKFSLERTSEFNHQRRILSGQKGGSSTQSKYNLRGENNANWKGGVSKNRTKYNETQKHRYPEKVRARRLVINARKRGEIIRVPCVECGNENSFAHHEDYSKPLEVIWLCRKHHREKHDNKH